MGTDDNSSQTVAVAIQKLRRGVHNEIRAKGERLLEIGGHEGVVHNQCKFLASRNLADGSKIAEAHERIRGGLDVNHARVLADRALYVVGIGGVDIRKLQP